jgi:sulfide dehydrogenase cytochrome subunit
MLLGAAVALVVSPTIARAQIAEAPAGALACSGCHPDAKNVSTPAPRLVGRDAGEITTAMQAFRSGARASTIMDRIAKGFSDDETRAIANWYAAQKD